MDTLRLEFLGTGTSQGVPVIACDCAVCRSEDTKDARLRCSVRIQLKGKELLIDAGPDLRQQLLRSGMTDLDAVLLTHEHMDHVAGIDELRAFNFKQQRPMDIHGNPATNKAVERMFHYAFAKDKYPGVPDLNLITIEGKEPFDVHGIRIVPIEVLHHQLTVLGFRIGDLAYITDAKTIAPEERSKLRNLDVLIVNALRKKEHLTHLNIKEALEVVEDLRPKRTYLTHISHLMGRHEEVEADLPNHVRLAYDGQVVEVPYEA